MAKGQKPDYVVKLPVNGVWHKLGAAWNNDGGTSWAFGWWEGDLSTAIDDGWVGTLPVAVSGVGAARLGFRPGCAALRNG